EAAVLEAVRAGRPRRMAGRDDLVAGLEGVRREAALREHGRRRELHLPDDLFAVLSDRLELEHRMRVAEDPPQHGAADLDRAVLIEERRLRVVRVGRRAGDERGGECNGKRSEWLHRKTLYRLMSGR